MLLDHFVIKLYVFILLQKVLSILNNNIYFVNISIFLILFITKQMI